jgi:HSP20 family protein
MGSIASDLAAARQQMRSDMIAARQQMNIMKPAYQMFDNGEQFQISLDVPGVKASDIQVKLEEDGKVLSLSGSRKVVREGGTYSSSFSRRFTLDPSLDTDHLTANLQNGVLTVSAPKDLKKTEETIKSIPVTEIGNAKVKEIGTEEETPNPTIQATEESTDTIISTKQEEDAAEVDTIDLDEKN